VGPHDTKYFLAIRMKVVKTEFVHNEEEDHPANGDACGQAEYFDEGEDFVFRKVSPGDAGMPSFFLDEATAFAAGHRPCFECRRDVAHYFRQCWVRGNPADSFTETTSID